MGAFHPGELEVQARLQVREDAERVGRIVNREIPAAVRPLLARQRIVVAASVDTADQPWASVLAGPPGFLAAVDERLLRVAATPAEDDPLTVNLRSRPELGLLVIDLRTRQRLRLNGRGLLSPEGVFLLAEEVYANCPKYIQKRRLAGKRAEGVGVARPSASLDARQQALAARADTFFIATWHPEGHADSSHRGGRPGFVRVLDERTLEFPDYPGNNMFNTLGNLSGHPKAGLLFLDFDEGDVLQLAGRARIRWKPETAVRFEVEQVLATAAALPLRFELVEPWPGNPALAVTPGAMGHLQASLQGAPALGGDEGLYVDSGARRVSAWA